jgi:N-glycosylase/DNA lyase
LLPPRKVEEACYQFLCSSGINYRFPKIRAQQIALCWFPFCQVKDEYQEYVCSFANEELARSDIVGKFPGIGLKQASMFLRNIGACKNLSVVDVHVLYYLKTCHGWEVEQLTPKRYLEAEEIMRADALCHGLELNIFDTVVWSAARALKRASYV